jgi:hypothetical protein
MSIRTGDHVHPLTLPWKLTGIGQGCRKKSYSGTLSWSLDSMNPLNNRKDGPIMEEVTFAKPSLQIIRLIRFWETSVPDHWISPTLQRWVTIMSDTYSRHQKSPS